MPDDLVSVAKKLIGKGNLGIAFTYNEPLIGFEYVSDTAKLAKSHNLQTALVTNGMIETIYWRRILPYIDAVNIDLKSWQEDFYLRNGGDLTTVKRNIALAVGRCHVEVTTLIIPNQNDKATDMEDEAKWLASLTTGSDLPLHISRFFPRYKMTDASPTPVDTIYRLADVARHHLRYVYTGNC